MRVFGLFRAQKPKRFSIDAFSTKWQNKGFLRAYAGPPPDFSGRRPRFFVFHTLFPVVGRVAVSGFEIDRLTNASKDDFKPSKYKPANRKSSGNHDRLMIDKEGK